MPIRPNSHQLEDQSKLAFRFLFPPHWVVRDKSSDYGIDQEVEVFNEDGSSTGLVFLAQLRATASDDQKKQQRVTFEVEQLKYFSQHELPVLIFRFAAVTKKFYFRWAQSVFNKNTAFSSKSMTVRFEDGDEWTIQSSALVRRRISQLRWLRSLRSWDVIPLAISVERSFPGEKYDVISAIRTVVARFSLVRITEIPAINGNCFECIANDNLITVRIGDIGFCSAPLDKSGEQGITSSLSYALCSLLELLQVSTHAIEIAKFISDLGLLAPTREHAYFASRALISDLPRSIALAKLNGIPTQRDMIFLNFVRDIYVGPYNRNDKVNCVLDFFEETVAVCVQQGDSGGLANTYYNIGNFMSNQGRLAYAVTSYNKARKAVGDYVNRPYFLRELSGCLFVAGKFRCALAGYMKCGVDDLTPHNRFCLADSLLFAGKFSAATEQFNKIEKTAPLSLRAEVALKVQLSEWLALWTDRSDMTPKSEQAWSEINSMGAYDGENAARVYERISRQLDPYHSMSAFNLGVVMAERSRHVDAMMLFLIAAFRHGTDVDAWANALACSLREGSDLNRLVSIILAAYFAIGDGVFAKFRKIVPESSLPAFDEVLENCRSQIQKERERKGVRMRIHSKDSSDPIYVFDIPKK